MHKKKWFTLLEMLLVIIISGSLLTTIYSVMVTLPRVKHFNDARQALIEETNWVMNRFAELFQDYTIDYEEYFNRSKIWTQTESWHYSVFSAYGNENSVSTDNTWRKKHRIKYCSSGQDPEGRYYSTNNCKDWEIWITVPTNKRQSYGQYKMLFRDVGVNTDWKERLNPTFNRDWAAPDLTNYFPEVGDSDDRDLGIGPVAIPENPQEIYLISHDGQRRVFLRINETENWRTIQILRLRGFDAGSDHTFNSEDPKTYDGEIDTWACDYGQGFNCNETGTVIWDTYKNYKLANSVDDGWVNLFDSNISVKSWKIHIAPNTNPDYAWQKKDVQINPYISISLTTELNYNKWKQKLWNMLTGYTYSLKWVYDTKWFYLK